MSKCSRYLLIASFLGLSLTACDTGAGPQVPSANTRILFKADALPVATAIPNGGATILADMGDAEGWSRNVVSLDAVSSINVTLAAIQVLRTESDTMEADTLDQDTMNDDSAGVMNDGEHGWEQRGGWVTVDVPTGTSVDLMNLPAAGMTVTDANLQPGTYRGLRMLFTDATITLSKDVTLPDSSVVSAGTYPLQIGGRNGWLSVQVTPFTVAQGQTDVVVTFDPAASVRAIIVRHDGTFFMPPVVRASGEHGEDAGHD